MIITRTPYRISLFGGGSDMPNWYQKYEGLVVSFSIDKYCYISCRELPPFFDHNYRLVYSIVELESDIDSIKHPAIREGIRFYADKQRLEIQHHGDLPARSGIGSSSAFAVGLVSALKQLNGKSASKYELAKEAIYLEQDLIKECVGSQDQIACSFGGMNVIEFNPSTDWKIKPLILHPDRIAEIEDRCFLVFSGISRTSSHISENLLKNLKSQQKSMDHTVELAKSAISILDSNSNLDDIGYLMNIGWDLKVRSNPLANNTTISDFIGNGIRCGALGAKVLGAGGGGFILFWLKATDKVRFREEFNLGVEVPFKIDFYGACTLESKDWVNHV